MMDFTLKLMKLIVKMVGSHFIVMVIRFIAIVIHFIVMHFIVIHFIAIAIHFIAMHFIVIAIHFIVIVN